MGGAAAATTEVCMKTMDDTCVFCGADALEPVTETITQGMGGVRVTIEGVSAEHCRACDEVGIIGKIAVPLDAAIEQILVATGVAAPPDPEVDAAPPEEMRELAKSLGQENLLDRPSGAKSTA
jgi:YgiT-type zinc finger domain-containing protein